MTAQELLATPELGGLLRALLIVAGSVAGALLARVATPLPALSAPRGRKKETA